MILATILRWALRANSREHEFELWWSILENNIAHKHPRSLLEGLPVHLQQDIELATFSWKHRNTWSYLRVDRDELDWLYRPVQDQARQYFLTKLQREATSRTFVPAPERMLQAIMVLFATESTLSLYIAELVGVPWHRCPQCIVAFARCSKSTLASFFIV